MADVQRERVQAENDLGREPAAERLTPEHVRALVAGVHDVVALLADADPADKAAIYAGLGLRLTYHAARRVVAVEADASYRVGTRRQGGITS